MIDKDGRSIISAGFLQNVWFTLVNVYAPKVAVPSTDRWRFQCG